MTGETVALRLGRYAEAVARDSLQPAVVHGAKRVLVDYMAALLAGAASEPAVSLARALPEEVGHGPASLPGRNLRALPRAAALINGTASHIVEFDDIFRDGIYHPGCPTIAAAVAVAESRGLGGEALLRAIVAGYEISTRIAAAIQPSHYRFWHTTGTVGTLGAAVAAAAGRSLDFRKTGHAIATAATFAAALQQAFRSDAMSKPLHAGRAAEGGYVAAAAAEEGVTGALDILEGEAGFGRAMSGDVDWGAVTGDLGRRFNILDMTVKNHGCCGHTFAAIDGALALQKEHGFAASDVESVAIGTYATALKVCGKRDARTPFEAKFSLAYVVAHALVFGSVRLDAYDAGHLDHPEVLRLMHQSQLSVDDAADSAFPGRREANVTIVLKDGRRFSFRQPTRKGDPDAPLTDEELEDKFRELAAPVLGDGAAERVLRRLWDIDRSARVDLIM